MAQNFSQATGCQKHLEHIHKSNFPSYFQLAVLLGALLSPVAEAAPQSNEIPVELGQIAKEKEIAELLEETVVAKSGSVEDAEVSNEVVEVVAVNPVVTEVLEEPVPVGIDAIPVVKSVEVRWMTMYQLINFMDKEL